MKGVFLISCLIGVGCAHTPPSIHPTAAAMHAIEPTVIPVHFADARDTAQALRTILPPSWGADIRADVARNALIVRANPEAVVRVRALVAPVGDPPTETVDVVHLLNATAESLLPAVQAAAPQGIVVIADEPTNSLVLAGPLGWSPDAMRAFIRTLDLVTCRPLGS